MLRTRAGADFIAHGGKCKVKNNSVNPPAMISSGSGSRIDGRTALAGNEAG